MVSPIVVTGLVKNFGTTRALDGLDTATSCAHLEGNLPAKRLGPCSVVPVRHAAIFDPVVPLPKLDSWHWRRKFRCPNATCADDRRQTGKRGRRVLGWLQIQKGMHLHGAPMRPDGTVEPGASVVPDEVYVLIEKVWLAKELKDLPDLPDGTRSFGLPEGARGNSDASSRAHAISVLASAGPTPFQGSGDPYRAQRHAAGRTGGGTGYWVIALTYPKTLRPFVVTCPDCESRCWVDSSLPETELRRLDAPSASPIALPHILNARSKRDFLLGDS